MDIVAALRSRAEMSAKAMQLMARSKSERNQAAGDVGAIYDGGTREQTVEWRAAEEIERLRTALTATVSEREQKLEAEVRRLFTMWSDQVIEIDNLKRARAAT